MSGEFLQRFSASSASDADLPPLGREGGDPRQEAVRGAGDVHVWEAGASLPVYGQCRHSPASHSYKCPAAPAGIPCPGSVRPRGAFVPPVPSHRRRLRASTGHPPAAFSAPAPAAAGRDPRPA